MLIALVYDLFRIKRRAIKTSTIFIYIEDLIFWVIVAIIMFAVIYYSNEGEIRGYIFIGTAIGITLYILLFSRIVINSFLFVLKTIYRILKFIWKVLTYPFRIIFKLLSYPVNFFVKLSGKTLRKVKQIGRGRAVKIKFWRKVFRNARKKM